MILSKIIYDKIDRINNKFSISLWNKTKIVLFLSTDKTITCLIGFSVTLIY